LFHGAEWPHHAHPRHAPSPRLICLRRDHRSKVESTLDGKIYESLVVCDPAISAKRPGVLIVHQWMGITDHEIGVAKKLAAMGYVAFVADIYGKGVRPKNMGEAGKQAGMYRAGDGALFRKHLQHAFDTMKTRKNIDASKIAAIGYCFGGGGVLEMARMGIDIKGVVSFHGALKTALPAAKGAIKSKILVCHGADDPFVPEAERLGFIKEMRASAANWQLNAYCDAVHAFTQKSANRKGKAEYNEQAAKRSWVAMTMFLKECFG
jgi:dienelactone hydrolase